jgi:hypothetical protein
MSKPTLRQGCKVKNGYVWIYLYLILLTNVIKRSSLYFKTAPELQLVTQPFEFICTSLNDNKTLRNCVHKYYLHVIGKLLKQLELCGREC